MYEEEDQSEISRFKINQIIFFARGNGANDTSDAACFAFTCSHGKTLQDAIFQVHAFRMAVPEAVRHKNSKLTLTCLTYFYFIFKLMN